MRALLEKLELKNYRSCIRTTFNLNSSLSALIGPNGAGKTNVMHGMLLLRKLLKFDSQQHSESGVDASCGLNATFRVGRNVSVQFRAKIRYTTNERNTDELVASEQEWNLGEGLGADHWISLPVLSFPWELLLSERGLQQALFSSPLPASRKVSAMDRRRLLAVMRHRNLSVHDYYLADALGGALKAVNPKRVQSAANAIRHLVSGMTYYGASQFTDPSRSPIYFELEDGSYSRRVSMRGREHMPFLHGLYSMWKERDDEFNEYMGVVGMGGVGLISDLDFREIATPANVYDVQIGGKIVQKTSKRVLVIPQIKIGRSILSPNQLSEGTFKTLALIYHLLTDRSQLLLIEEPEVCVHHGLLESVIELIKRESQRKQIVVSTHSDFVLDAIKPENVFIVKSHPKRGTLLDPVPDTLSKRQFEGLREYLRSSGNLGEFWRHGGLE